MNDIPKKVEDGEMKQEMVAKEDYQRLAADFENYKKQQATMQEEMAKFSSMAVIIKMLDVLDSIEQAIEHAPESVTDNETWFEGLRGVQKSFVETIGKVGAERMSTQDMAFDPATMEAISSTAGGESNVVQSEQRAGWTMHGRVIRPARVIVFE